MSSQSDAALKGAGAGGSVGATIGAGIGSIVPGLGTAIGGAIGGAVGAVVGGVGMWLGDVTGGKRNFGYYNTLVDNIHRTFPGRDVATCEAAISYCQGELGKGSTTGEWLHACTDCLKEYQSYMGNAQAAANQAAATGNTAGYAVLTGANVKAVGLPNGAQSLLKVSSTASSSNMLSGMGITSWLTVGVGVFVVFQLLKG